MPAASASPIHPVVDHLVDAVDHQRVGRGVLAALDVVPEPRKPRGVWHQINTILTLAVCAVMARCQSFTAIGEWAADIQRDPHVHRLLPGDPRRGRGTDTV